MTSVGRITPLFTTADTASPFSASASVKETKETEREEGWKVVNVANSFTLRWFRPVCHSWEWQGRTIVRIAATGEYDDLHSVEKMRDGMGWVNMLDICYWVNSESSLMATCDVLEIPL